MNQYLAMNAKLLAEVFDGVSNSRMSNYSQTCYPYCTTRLLTFKFQ